MQRFIVSVRVAHLLHLRCPRFRGHEGAIELGEFFDRAAQIRIGDDEGDDRPPPHTIQEFAEVCLLQRLLSCLAIASIAC